MRQDDGELPDHSLKVLRKSAFRTGIILLATSLVQLFAKSEYCFITALLGVIALFVALLQHRTICRRKKRAEDDTGV